MIPSRFSKLGVIGTIEFRKKAARPRRQHRLVFCTSLCFLHRKAFEFGFGFGGPNNMWALLIPCSSFPVPVKRRRLPIFAVLFRPIFGQTLTKQYVLRLLAAYDKFFGSLQY